MTGPPKVKDRKKSKGETTMYKRECDIDGCFFETEGSAFVAKPDLDLQEHLRTGHNAEEYKEWLVRLGVDAALAVQTAAEAYARGVPDELQA